jgi:hypothetical protein
LRVITSVTVMGSPAASYAVLVFSAVAVALVRADTLVRAPRAS